MVVQLPPQTRPGQSMRIVYQSDGYLPDVIGGVEVFSHMLLEALRARGHEILVVTSCIGDQPPGRYRHGGTEMVKFRFGETLMSSNLSAVAGLQGAVNGIMADFRADLFHINDSRASSFFMVRRGALANVPRLLTLHSPIRPTHKRALLDRLAHDCDTVVAVSQFVAASAAADMPGIRGRLQVIANSLPPPPTRPAPLPAQPILMCIGRIIEDKGMGTAIEALGLLRNPAARLIIVGDGPYREALQAQVAACGLQSQVEFRGWLMPQDVPHAINAARIVLVPSICEEAFGLVALQAAQMGRPVIASRIGGLPEVVKEGITGLLVPPDDPAGLANAIATLVADPALATRMGVEGRSNALTQHDFSRVVDAYEGVYGMACHTRMGLCG